MQRSESVVPPATAGVRNKSKGLWQKIKAHKTLYLFLMPAVLLVLVFNYVPMVGLIMAFQDYRANLGWFGSEFVGLTHFVEFLDMIPKK